MERAELLQTLLAPRVFSLHSECLQLDPPNQQPAVVVAVSPDATPGGETSGVGSCPHWSGLQGGAVDRGGAALFHRSSVARRYCFDCLGVFVWKRQLYDLLIFIRPVCCFKFTGLKRRAVEPSQRKQALPAGTIRLDGSNLCPDSE